MANVTIDDKEWIRSSFMLPKRALSDEAYRRRIYNPGFTKFSDTTFGGNQAINPPPQFTRFADIEELRVAEGVSQPMGRYYSEVIDDNSVLVHMRFGTPSFNSLTSFMGNFYSSDAASLVNTGRGKSIFFKLGEAITMVASIRVMPILMVFQLGRYLSGSSKTKYYELSPNMHVYWMAVQTTLNTVYSNMGFVSGMNVDAARKQITGDGFKEGPSLDWSSLLPDVYESDGTVNIMKVANRYQRLADRRYSQLSKLVDSAKGTKDYAEKVLKLYHDSSAYKPEPSQFNNIFEYMDSAFGTKLFQQKQSSPEQVKNEDGEEVYKFDVKQESSSDRYDDPNSGAAELETSIADHWKAEVRDGSQFVTFRVDNPGTVSESFSNTAKEAELAQELNNKSKSAKTFRFNAADGNLADLGFVGDMISGVVGAAGDLVSGALSALHLSGIAAMAGNGLVDIPKYYDSSSSSLPKITFNMELRSPYGNDLSRVQNLLAPLVMLLTGALPRSVGANSYSAPFLCEMYCKGRNQVRLGMIDSVSVTRGVGAAGWTPDGKPLAIDVSFSVLDMSSIMHMPMNNGFSAPELLTPGGLSKYLFAEDSTFNDYLATLTSLSLTQQIYQVQKLKRQYWATLKNFNDWTSAESRSSWLLNSGSVFGLQPGRIISALTVYPERV